MPNDPKPFAIVPFNMVEIKKRAAAKLLWYYHDYIVLPLFTEQDSSLVQLLIINAISTESVGSFTSYTDRIDSAMLQYPLSPLPPKLPQPRRRRKKNIKEDD